MDPNQPGSSSGVIDITFTKTEKGRRMLVRHGFMYTFHRQYKVGSGWRCTNRSCNATITISEKPYIKILYEGNHKCQPNLVKAEIIKIKNQCKEEARTTTKPMPKLFEEAFKTTKDAGYGLLQAVPKFSNMSRSLYNARNRELNVPKTHFCKREHVIIPDKYKHNFLLFDDDSDPVNRIIAFSTESARKVIPNIQTFFSDGTFSSCCIPFYQLYCIHGDINSTDTVTNIVPLIYVLMPDKQEQSYKRLFILLKKHLPNWKPETIVVDFEIAVINVIRLFFPNTEIRGCNFHFKQALTKKAQALKLDNLEDKRHLAMCAALAHVKQEDIEDAWLLIMEEAPNSKAITEFNDYFVKQWLENKNLEYLWNVHGARHRTINLAEAWHKRLNNNMGKKKPFLLQFLDVLKSEADYVDWKLKRIRYNISNNMRTRQSIANDKDINKILENYDEMTLAEVLQKLSVLQRLGTL